LAGEWPGVQVRDKAFSSDVGTMFASMTSFDVVLATVGGGRLIITLSMIKYGNITKRFDWLLQQSMYF
jgi:hypothetical protein